MPSPPRCVVDFNPRTHGECDFIYLLSTNSENNFNPRTHGECDPQKAYLYPAGTDISIHALTGSATVYFYHFLRHHSNFNPRTHGECDFYTFIKKLILIYFNPRTHGECDTINALNQSISELFQSTHSRGVRLVPMKK